jgi:hypothetical protein
MNLSYLTDTLVAALQLQGEFPDAIQEPNYFTSRGEYRVDDQASEVCHNVSTYVSFCVYHVAAMAPLCIADVTNFEDNINRSAYLLYCAASQ